MKNSIKFQFFLEFTNKIINFNYLSNTDNMIKKYYKESQRFQGFSIPKILLFSFSSSKIISNPDFDGFGTKCFLELLQVYGGGKIKSILN